MQMIEVVQNQQHVFVLQVIEKLLDWFCGSGQAQVKGGGDFNGNRLRQVIIIWIELRQINQPDPIRILTETTTSDRDGETCFTHATQPRDGDKPAPGLIETDMDLLLEFFSAEELVV